jgi:Exostosin family
MTEKLKSLYELSDKRHLLTSDPDSADVILVANVPQQPLPLAQWGKRILEHKLITKYPGKSFSLSYAEHPLILHHGIYAEGVKSHLTLGRVRTGSYALYTDRYLNPYVKAHRFGEEDRAAKEYLLVFIGRRHVGTDWTARNAIFNLTFSRADILIEDSTEVFNVWHPHRASGDTLKRQKRYYDILLRAKFSLCPRGSGANSIRLFESMQLGVAPVIISDKWILPRGPKWSDFSVIVKEKHINNIEKIVEEHESAWPQMGDLARKAFERYFAEDVYFNYVVENCVDMMHSQPIPEQICWRLNPAVLCILQQRERLKLFTTKATTKLRAGVRLAFAGARHFSPRSSLPPRPIASGGPCTRATHRRKP